MQYFVQRVGEVPFGRYVSGVTGIMILFTWLLFLWAPFGLTEVVPLRMDAYFGVAYVAPAYQLVVLPVVATLVAFIHALLVWRFESADIILRALLIYTAGGLSVVAVGAMGWILWFQHYV